MTHLELQPADTLFFRDGKPFSMGDETWADAIFPPYPSVVHGTLRTAYGIKTGSTPDTIEADTADLHINELYLMARASLSAPFEKYYPMPLDLAAPFKKKDAKAVALVPTPQPALCSAVPGTHLLLAPASERVEPVSNGWISQSALVQYLEGDTDKIGYIRLSDLIRPEPKVGIGRDNQTRSTEEGKLYRVGMLRTEHCHIGVAFTKAQGEQALTFGTVKMGAEGKLVTLRAGTHPPLTAPQIAVNAGDCFRVWLATPGCFDKDIVQTLKKHLNIEADLLAGAVGRNISIGGWDLKNQCPKPMRSATPGGSVWHLRAKKDIQLGAVQGRSISDYGQEQGFGIAYFGTIHKNLYV